MTLRQLLLTGKITDIKYFFRDVQDEPLKILVAMALHLQTFPEEFQTKEIFLEELQSLKAEKDFSEFSPTIAKTLSLFSSKDDWNENIEKAIEVIESC